MRWLWQPQRWLVWVILATGLLLRLAGLSQMPFQHDEFSAIFRLNYQSLNELMRQGVALRDSHPAGVQIFLYYWKSLVGLDHFWWRLPFVFFGLAGVMLLYLSASRLFGKSSALMGAAAMATMQYFVYYSQMARPYMPGIFFLLLAFFLILEIKRSEYQGFGAKHLLLAVGLSFSAWIHHFAAFQAGLLFLSAFVILPKVQYKNLLWVALLALLFYLPGLEVSITQIKAGGIGDWLGKPEKIFLWHFFSYVSNHSVVFALALAFAAMPIALHRVGSGRIVTERLLLVLLFVFPLALGWVYSIWRVPVLQFSTLIFGFPFLLMAFFSFAPTENQKLLLLKVGLILFTGAGSLIWQRQHIRMMQQQGFAEVPKQAVADAAALGQEYTFLAVSNTPDMFGFYMPDSATFRHRFFSKQKPISVYMQCLDTLKSEYLGLAWADYVPYEWVAQARAVFGEVVMRRSWYNAEYYLLRRNCKPVLADGCERMLQHTFFGTEGHIDQAEYALLFESDSLFVPMDDVVAINILGIAHDTVQQLRLVLEFKVHPDSIPVLWLSGETGRKILPGQSFSLSAAWRFDSGPEALRKYLFRTYLWNTGHENFSAIERRIWTATYDKAMFGLFRPL